MQMFVLDLDVTHYVVWKPNDLLVLKIRRSEDFWSKNYPKTEKKFKNVILHELLATYYTKKNEWLKTRPIFFIFLHLIEF